MLQTKLSESTLEKVVFEKEKLPLQLLLDVSKG
jgi:hypothetical protein